MGTNPAGQGPQRPTFSPDGMWLWDGTTWKSTLSPDRMWRWNGQAWVPAGRSMGGGGAAAAVLITVVAFGGVLVLVSVVVIVVLLTMGNQIANVFSNVVAALASPSP